MPMFRATKKGYYGDVIHDPDTGRHVIFEAPADFHCSWAELVDPADEQPDPADPTDVTVETQEAEALLDGEADAAADDVGVHTL